MNEFNDDNVIDLQERLAAGKVAKAIPPEELKDVVVRDELVFTNDKADTAVRQLFHMLYQMTYDNKLGLMHAKNIVTGNVETLIVGTQRTEDGFACFPLAKVLTEEEQVMYQSPTGSGEYV